MPDLSNLVLPHFPELRPCGGASSAPTPPPLSLSPPMQMPTPRRMRTRTRTGTPRVSTSGGSGASGSLSRPGGRARWDWVEKKVASGVPEKECFLPFLTNSPRMVECRLCSKVIYPREEVQCSVSGCQGTFHQTCAKSKGGLSKPFKCPQHEAFNRLPLPYINEEFSIGAILNDVTENKAEPSPYVHIKRNVYLVKKKRNGADAGVGCTNCRPDSTCKDDCECRGLSISCSKACHCSDMCKNKPFRKEKKIKVVKTENCGWGVVALESIDKGDFVIEYIGEVIDDATCEQRLWDMKFRGDQKFYMCEISKDFTIDATFKGNASRFLNHSCNPNCKLEKWQVDGETRVGIFASRSIEVGEPLTYDYRFVLFGSTVKCCCGASNCQGYLGTKKKVTPVVCHWGCKRKRTSMIFVPNKRTEHPVLSCLRQVSVPPNDKGKEKVVTVGLV
uniref:Histone-lysine N-methyltransferase ASHR3 n=1 Tax=Ananas comosus var. bracteatus TaxID=296719 RepID=A0A6V7P2H4_ANACO|nr:unnamed protein product [Ananas comosus var. bracteatus]